MAFEVSTTSGGTGGASSPLTTKGDLWAYGPGDTRLPVSTDDFALFGSSGAVKGLAWAAVTESKLSLSDNTTLDVSTSKHGFVPKLPNDATKFLNGVGAWVAGGSSDATAWHLNGDTLGAAKYLGSNDNFNVSFKANGKHYLTLAPYVSGAPAGGARSAGDIGNFLMGTGVALSGAEESGWQYRRNDTAATLLLICDQDGSQGQGYGESAVEVLNDGGKSTIMTCVGSAFAGTSFGYNTAGQGRLRCSGDVLIFGTSTNKDVAHITNNTVRMVLKNDGSFRYGGDLSALGSENFTIRGDGATTGAHFFQSATTGVVIKTSLIAVGHAAPSVAFHAVSTAGKAALYLDDGSAGHATQIYMGNLSGADILNCYIWNDDHTLNMEYGGSAAWNMKAQTSWNIKYQTTKRIEINSTGIGMYGASPVAQGSAVADASGGAIIDAEARTALNALLARVRSLGAIAT